MSRTASYDERRIDVAAMMITLSLLLIGVFLLSGCSFLTPEQKASLIQYAQAELAAGRITKDQYDAMINAWEGGRDWIGSIVEVVVGVGLSLAGVTWIRGPIGNRRGIEALSTQVAEKIAQPSVMVTPVQ